MSSEHRIEGESKHKERALALFAIAVLLFSAVSALIQSNSNPGIEDDQNAPAAILSNPNQNNTLVFHLHWDNVVNADRRYWMNTSSPYSPSNPDYDGDGSWGITIEKTPAASNYTYFILSPLVNAPLRMRGNLTFDFWASSSTDNISMGLTASLFDSSDLLPGGDLPLSSSYISKPIPAQWTLHEITIPLGSYDLSANHSLVLNLSRENIGPNAKLRVFFDQTLFDSTLTMHALSQFNISDSDSYGSDGVPRTEFGNQENIFAFANISDVLGAYDIKSADIVIRNLSDSSIVYSSSMVINATEAGTNPSWKLFDQSIGMFNRGNYNVNITVRDLNNDSDWVEWNLKVISIDHFVVTVSKNRVGAGNPFNVTVDAVDSFGSKVSNWSGIIAIEAIDNISGLVVPGLKILSVFMPSTANGTMTFYENFTTAPIVIRIRVSEGSAIGQSQPITVVPGAVEAVAITPGSINSLAGITVLLSANGTDGFGNRNDSWTPYWQMTPENGTLISIGYSLQLTLLRDGHAVLLCQDNATGVNATINVDVSSAALYRIVVTPVNDTIWEGRMTNINAIGYDVFNNVVDISSALWSSEGFAMSFLFGSGTSGTLTGGMAPESGEVMVKVGMISGTADISVVTPPFGPSLGSLGNQVIIEDISKVITLNWQDVNGTNDLSWFVTGVNDSLLIIGHNASAPNLVDIIPEPNANGMNYVTFWVRDPTGYTNNREILITVLPVNDPPAWVNDPPKTIYVKFGLAYIQLFVLHRRRRQHAKPTCPNLRSVDLHHLE